MTFLSDLLWGWTEYGFMRTALCAVLLIAPLYGLLGTMAVDGRMAFFSDSLGHGAFTGIAIGEGRTPQEVVADMGGVVEGYYAAVSAKELADSLGVEMPICEAMYDVLYNGAEVRGMVHRLMSRAPKRETDNGWV